MATDLDIWPYTCMLDSGIEWFLRAIYGRYTHNVTFGKYSSMLCVGACYAYKKEYEKATGLKAVSSLNAKNKKALEVKKK